MCVHIKEQIVVIDKRYSKKRHTVDMTSVLLQIKEEFFRFSFLYIFEHYMM
jgi:hypothetical protein